MNVKYTVAPDEELERLYNKAVSERDRLRLMLDVQNATSARLDAEVINARAVNTELFEALESIVICLESGLDVRNDKRRIDAARAAIAKATGGA